MRKIMLQKLIGLVLFLLVVFGRSSRQNVIAGSSAPLVFKYEFAKDQRTPDLETAASHHYGHPGRVQIKVYRGPEYDNHASHGYWVRQPADGY